MVRTYKKKTQRAFINENNIKQAIRDVINKTKSIRAAAADYNIHPATLQHGLKIFRKLHPDVNEIVSDDSAQENEVVSIQNAEYHIYTSNQVFTVQEEESLEKYFIKSSQIQYGLTYHQAQTLAYEFAIHCNKNNIPKSWIENKLAGLFWMHTVNEFFTNYISITTKYKFTPDRIYNIDESGISTVLPCPRVIAETGNALPPAIIFPSVRYKDYFLNGAPTGSLGLASKSGWMTSPFFVDLLKHFQKITNASKENSTLIHIDNHETHCSINAINYARNHGIHLLSFPPHTSHKLQPLDVGVYSSFKANCKTAFNNWMATNPGKQITIYNVPALSNIAFKNSFTIKNITSGFKKSGLWPINQLVFNDEDFLSCYRREKNDDDNANKENINQPIPSTSKVSSNIPNQSMTSPSIVNLSDTKLLLSNKVILIPEQIKPYPKAQPRVKKINSRQGKSRIYTSTPEKQRIEEILKAKEEKLAKLKKKVEPVKKKLKLVESSSEEDSISELSLSDSVGDISEEEFPLLCDDEELNLKDFVLVQFCTKKTKLHYIGCIQRIINLDELEINFFAS
ncbi:hypothetical protein NQ314_020055 [Rhamnusium bicolor]|uniref:DDE-1 domain-containing protein n=1 Tax=Rhamnusium bicolor TaxID=1586634 RepID=A0AAV8WMA9_9CUCU|nr:hypothetical protein NQ314_020055 [Rhamnusium bicolor]